MVKSPARSAIDSRPRKIRSAVSNGTRRFVEGDGRSPWSRRRRDIEHVYLEDLGGRDLLSGYQVGLVEVAATLRVELERQEGLMSIGKEVDLETYARIASHYRRIVESLGLERSARDVVPDLRSYIASRQREAAE